MIAFTVPGEPVAQGRPRAFQTPGGFIRTYDPAKSRTWKGVAQVHMQQAIREAGVRTPVFAEGPVSLYVVAIFACPASRHRKGSPRPREPHAKRPDVDNLVKGLMDAAEGLLYTRDAQVVEVTVRKITGAQGEAPGVNVCVSRLAASCTSMGNFLPAAAASAEAC